MWNNMLKPWYDCKNIQEESAEIICEDIDILSHPGEVLEIQCLDCR